MRLYSVSFCVSRDSGVHLRIFFSSAFQFTHPSRRGARRLPRRHTVKLARASPRRCTVGGGGVQRKTRSERRQTFPPAVYRRRRRSIYAHYVHL